MPSGSRTRWRIPTALDYMINSKIEVAYRRGDLFENAVMDVEIGRVFRGGQVCRARHWVRWSMKPLGDCEVAATLRHLTRRNCHAELNLRCPTTLPVHQRSSSLPRLSARTLEKHRTYGTGPLYRKIGGRVVYAIVDLRAWADSGLKTSTSDPSTGPAPARRRNPVADCQQNAGFISD